MAATSVMQHKDVSFGSHFYVYTVVLPNLSFVLYIEDIQVFGVNMSFISLSEVKNFYIS